MLRKVTECPADIVMGDVVKLPLSLTGVSLGELPSRLQLVSLVRLCEPTTLQT
jgi:hypothetical protein